MARPKTAMPEAIETNIDEAAFAQGHAALNEVAAINSEISANAQTLAVQIGYDGALSVGGLEDEIRFYQRRTVEACLELGKRLLLLKELTPYGEFETRIDMLGFNYRSAARFMSAAAKTAKSANLALLSTQVKSMSAFLELVTEDDSTLESLSELDDIDRMSASELRNTVRSLRGDVEAKDKVLADKSAALDKALVKQKINPLTHWPSAFGDLITYADYAHQTIKQQIAVLEDARLKAMQAEAAEGEEESLKLARKALAESMSRTVYEGRQWFDAFANAFEQTLAAVVED